mgnify:CR=1 FL=1
MVLDLFHGRPTSDEQVTDWGSQGPALYLDAITLTYVDITKLWFDGYDPVVFLGDLVKDGCFYYDGVYYGDFSVSMGSQIDKEPELFDSKKSLLKET